MFPTLEGGYVFLIPALSAIATLSILGIAYIHGKKHEESRVFLIFLVYTLVVLIGYTILSTQCAGTQVLLVNQLMYIALSFVPALMYHVIAVHIGYSNPLYIFFVYAGSVLFSVVLWSPSFLESIRTYEHGCYGVAGWMHHVFVVYVFTVVGGAVYHLFRIHFRNTTHSHSRALKMYIALVFSVAVTMACALLPAYGIASFLVLYAMMPLLSAAFVFAVFQRNHFRLRIIAIQTFVVYVAVASFIQIFMVDSAPLRVSATIITTFIVMFGVLVTHNTMIELEMREKGERLAKYLANTNARLRDLDKQKTEFVSIASHQLRGPIATIIGYTSLIQDGSYGPVNEKLQEPLSRIFESGRRISIMVDDFLNVTRIEQGLMLYRKTPTDVNELLRTIIEEQKPIAEKHGLIITYTTCTKEPVMLNADKTKIALVFQNILDNAIKFTPSGSITVSLQESDIHDKLFITFSDTGVGISHDEIGNLFTKFNRASNANTVSVYGAGLGLYIAREIIKAHDGWIHVSSGGLGHGATLTLELPVQSILHTAK